MSERRTLGMAARAGRNLSRVVGRLRNRLHPAGVVLVYHRIADPTRTAYRWVVDPDRFSRHAAILRERFAVLPLVELVARATAGNLPRRAVAVTFDDGYRDFADAALPVLEAQRIPATVFCVSGAVDQPSPFWWDELEHLLLVGDPRPSELRLERADRPRVWSTASRDARLEALRDLLAMMRVLPEDEQHRVVETVRRWAGDSDRSPAPLAMDAPQLRRVAGSPWVTVGAHTVSHAHLASLDPARLRHEIEGCRRALAGVLDRPVTEFAYPYGGPEDVSPAAVEAVREAGFELACLNSCGRVSRDTDHLELPRCPVHDWEGDRFFESVEGYLNG